MRFPKPIISTIFILSVALLISCNDQPDKFSADSLSSVEADGEGTVVLHYVPSEGFSYDDVYGNTTGVTIELFRDFVAFTERYLDVSLELELNPIESFTDFYQTVAEGEPGEFGVGNVTITEERRGELTFSPPYMKNIAVLITHGSIDEVQTKEEFGNAFDGLRGLAFEGTLHEARIDEMVRTHLPDAEVDYAHSNNEIIERTSGRNLYFSYVDIYNYWRARDRGEILTRHRIADDPGEEFGVIMPLESDWQELMELFFEEDGGFLYSGRYRDIMETHLGPELAELLLEVL